MGKSRLRLAREVIRLLIALIGLIHAVITLVGGATNYVATCLARTFISLSCRTGIRFLFLRRPVDKLGRWCISMFVAGGGRLTTFTTFAAVAMSRPSERTCIIGTLRHWISVVSSTA